MACINKEFCKICQKITEHVSYDDSFYGPTGCLICIKNTEQESKNHKQKQWESKNVEEKLDFIRQVLIDNGLI